MNVRNQPWWKPGLIALPVVLPLTALAIIAFGVDNPLPAGVIGLLTGYIGQALAARCLDRRERSGSTGPVDGWR